jgi:hypothetical protein
MLLSEALLKGGSGADVAGCDIGHAADRALLCHVAASNGLFAIRISAAVGVRKDKHLSDIHTIARWG